MSKENSGKSNTNKSSNSDKGRPSRIGRSREEHYFTFNPKTPVQSENRSNTEQKKD